MKKIFLICILFASASFALESKHEVTPAVMLDNADAMRALTLGALQYTYHINETFWVGMDGMVGKAVVDGGSGLTIQNGDVIWGAMPVFYYNLPALLGATQEKAQGSQAHLYTSVGVGYLEAGSEKGLYGVFGGGMLWESGLPWLGIRVDVKGMFYMLENTQGSDFNSDFALSIGPSFLF